MICKHFSQNESSINVLLDKQGSITLNLTHSEQNIDHSFNEIISFNHLFNLQPILDAGDGNCYHRSISVILFGSEKYHRMIRYLTIYTIIKNQNYFRSSFKDINGKTFECMVESSSNSRNWAGEYEALALSMMCFRPIIVFSMGPQIEYYAKLNCKYNEPIFLGFKSFHFTPFLIVKEKHELNVTRNKYSYFDLDTF